MRGFGSNFSSVRVCSNLAAILCICMTFLTIGWNGKQSEPSLLKRDRCLFLNNVFRHPNGSDIINDSFFWEAKLCKSTRKTMPSGFKFICEMPRDNADVGKCFWNTCIML